MFSKGLLLFLLNVVCVYGYLSKRDVVYKAKPGAVKNSKTIKCATAMTDPSNIGVRVDDSTGACEGLTWDSGITPENGDGYSYYDKKTTEENYTPPLLIGEGYTQWLFPGTFGEGGRLDVTITPTSDTSEFAMRILDITSTAYDVYSGPPEVFIASMSVSRDGNDAYFKTWHPSTWWVNRGGLPYPFTEGVPSNISFVADADNLLMILFDDLEAVNYTNPTDHTNARQLLISMGQGTTLNINSITFVGV